MAARCRPTFELELRAVQQGADLVVGIDEVGRGALAGPLVVGACALYEDRIPEGIDDSKKLSASRRLELAGIIKDSALCWAIARVGPEDIDRMGLGWALRRAAREAAWRALENIDSGPDLKVHFFVDGTDPLLDTDALPEGSVAVPLAKGDSRSASIAAASIIAKVHRDALMEEIAKEYPAYGFDSHKGYGTPRHLRALFEHGPSPIHRWSFVTVRAAVADIGEEK